MGSDDSKKQKQALGVISRLQTVARATRTSLAVHLLESGLYAGQDQVMIALAQENGLTLGQIAARLNVKPPTVTKTVTRLQAQGFVERKGSETDMRQTHVHLTEAGLATIRRIEKSVRRTEKAALKGLRKKDVKALMRILGRIEDNLHARSEGQPVAVDAAPDEAQTQPENV